jgi:hypothetical protein
MAHFDPLKDRYGSRGWRGRRSALAELAPRFAILFALGLMVALAPGLSERARTIAELVFWVALPLLILVARYLRG